MGTVRSMSAILSEFASSAFISSWMGQARDTDVFSAVHQERSAGWARWVIKNLDQFHGKGERKYLAIRLPGRFYTPGNSFDAGDPHLEISSSLIKDPDPLFPQRVAQAGNALIFPSWIPGEVVAVKRAVLGGPRGNVQPFLDTVNAHRKEILDCYASLTLAAEKHWLKIYAAIADNPATISESLSSGFSSVYLANIFPDLRELNVSMVGDSQLIDRSGERFCRRVGVWTFQNSESSSLFSLGAVTPRLTRSSLFTDPLFTPSSESSVALLARCLVLSKVIETIGEKPEALVPHTYRESSEMYLKIVPAQRGQESPVASFRSARLFIKSYPHAADAWTVLQQWASSRGALSVSETDFLSSYSRVSAQLMQGRNPQRVDVDALLPLLWDKQNKVGRVTAVTASARS
jgi:hypothetical protein